MDIELQIRVSGVARLSNSASFLGSLKTFVVGVLPWGFVFATYRLVRRMPSLYSVVAPLFLGPTVTAT